MFKSGHEYHKYCKCTEMGNTAETMCDFCKKYSKLRYYHSLYMRNKLKPGTGMSQTLVGLRLWYYNVVGRDFEAPGRGKKPYLDNRSNGITKEEVISNSPLKPDTFEYSNNKITIKDSRDIKCLVIDLDKREIFNISAGNKYKFDNHSIDELYKESNQLNEIKKILKGE